MKINTPVRRLFLRAAELIIILLVLSFLVFALMYLAPGDPAEKRLTSQGIAVTKQVLQAERERLGLLRPFLVRYAEWLSGIVRGDFGISFKDELPVSGKLLAGLKNTLILSAGSFFLSLAIALPLGIAGAVLKDRIPDHLIRILSFVGNSMPNYLISVLLMYFFCIRLRLFPVIAAGDLKGLFLPALSLAIPLSSRFIRQIRAELLSQLEEDYVTGLRLRGVKESDIILKNVLPASLGHVLTILALAVGTLMGGSVVIETIFRWPGIGKLVMDSIKARDYPVILGFVLIMGTIYAVINLLADIAGGILDPRTQKKGE